ncbi:MAG: MFS transporter [Solirubrobacteraceae bacterium]
MRSSAEPSPQRGPGSAWLLAVCCVAQFMVILDLSIVNVALPSIQSSLGFTAPDLQWVVDAYAITFAGFLMLGGRAADYFGQRRTFVTALLLFGLASLAGGIAPDRAMLIGARAGQGFAGALMAASSLAIITSSYPSGPKLNRAIGIWAAMNGAGGAAGTLFGGVITQAINWRWVLLINPPIALGAALLAYAVVSDRRRREGRSFDLGGALTLTVGLMALVYGVVKADGAGWSSLATLGPIVIGLVLLAVFVVIETRVAAAPLVPFRQLTRPLRTANTIVLLFSAALFPMWFVSSLYLQQVLGLSPLDSGLAFLPMTLAIMLVASRAGRLVSHFGLRPVLGGGLIMMTAGLLLFTRIADSGSAIVYVIIPGLLTAAGIGMSIVPSTIAATQGAKEGQAGLASGLVNTSRQVGGGLGLALLITLATQYTTSLIGTGQAVPQALTEGFRLAYLIGAGLSAAAALLTFAALPRSASPQRPASVRLRGAVGLVVVVAAFVAVSLATAGSHGAPIGAYTTNGAYSFVTAPALHPPKLRTAASAGIGELSSGYVFLASFYDLSQPPMVGQSGPLILDRRAQPAWFRPVPESVLAANLSLQTYRGRPMLAWWQGKLTSTGQTLSGEDIVIDQHYRTVGRLKGADGWIITLHSLVVSGENVWVTANKNIPMNLSRYGGAYNGALIDSAVQEYNLRTGKLLRTWDALGHIPLTDSHASLPTNGFPWDAFHVNAIDLTGDGSFIVSMRNTWGAYLVNRTGAIAWALGGKHSSFRLGSGAEFEWQHDVALRPGSRVTMFDDRCCQITGAGTFVSPTTPSRGLVLKLDRPTRTATLVAQYTRGENFDAEYMGNTESLPNHNVFVGWGSQPYFSEYNQSGRLLLDAVFPKPDLSYRASLEQWVGLPRSSPVGAAREQHGKTTVYASWNGATRVAAWRVLAGPSASRLATLSTTAKSGFETAIAVPQGLIAFGLVALDARGARIGASRPFGVTR